MKFAKKICYFVILFVFVLGCAHIPKSEHPVEIERAFNAPFDKTWDSVIDFVKFSKGIIITSDKSSGIIVYRCESDIYMNVYLKSESSANTTVVYLFPRVRPGYYSSQTWEGVERGFFETLEKNLKER